MTASQLSLLGAVAPLFPLAYFLLASLTFFLASFRDPVVTRVLRGLFDTYFMGLIACTLASALAFAFAGNLVTVAAMAAAASLAVAARRWFLRQIDAAVAARDRGVASALPRLRRLHVMGIAYNALHLAALVAAIPLIVTAR